MIKTQIPILSQLFLLVNNLKEYLTFYSLSKIEVLMFLLLISLKGFHKFQKTLKMITQPFTNITWIKINIIVYQLIVLNKYCLLKKIKRAKMNLRILI